VWPAGGELVRRKDLSIPLSMPGQERIVKHIRPLSQLSTAVEHCSASRKAPEIPCAVIGSLL